MNTRPDYPAPADTRPPDNRPGRDIHDHPAARIVLAVLAAYLAVAIPLIGLRLLWQIHPALSILVAATAATDIYRKVTR